jgi:hypothetical protein
LKGRPDARLLQVTLTMLRLTGIDLPDSKSAEAQSLLKQLAGVFQLDRAGCGVRNIRRVLGAVDRSRQISMRLAFAVHGNAYDLSTGVDGTGIEKKQRGIGRNHRVEIYRSPAIPPEECAWIEVRLERYAGDISAVVDAQGDTGDVALDRSKILDGQCRGAAPAPYAATPVRIASSAACT